MPSRLEPAFPGPATVHGGSFSAGQPGCDVGRGRHMNVAIFGAAGWTGRAVLSRFAGRHEERCRSFHDAYGMRIIVLRPDYIVDSRLGLGRHRERLGPGGTPTRNGWVCRHDLAEACCLALESEAIPFDIFHIVGTPEAE